MPVLYRMALRNLKEHKGKTLIIGILIALGVFILILGNALLTTASEGTRKAVIDNYTGHLMVRAVSDTPVTITGSASITGDSTGKTIPNYQRVYDILEAQPEVLAINPQITSFAQIDFSTPDQNMGAFAFFFGVEPSAYQDMFSDNLEIVEGSFLEPGQQGVVISEAVAEEIRTNLGVDIQIGDELKFQSLGVVSGLNIRRLEMVGVYRFIVDSPALSGFTFIDAQSLRSMTGMVLGASAGQEISAEDTALLGLGDDELFAADDLFASDDLFSETTVDIASAQSTMAEDELFGFLGDLSERTSLSQPDAGAWTYVLLRLADPNQAPFVQARLNATFAEEGIAAEVVDWTIASGGVAAFNQAFAVFFLIVVLLITIVSIIIIMNTLVISVIERTYEIGAMRALGAQRSFIRRMFIAETMSISLVFGAIGLGIGVLTIGILNLVGLNAPNEFFSVLFGGEVLRPVLSPAAFILALLMTGGIGFLSSLYPVSVALKIQPVQALQSA